MYAAIGNVTVQPGKKAELIRWYKSILPQLKQLLPGLITQYVVETGAEDTVLSIAIYESEAAATAPPSSQAHQKIVLPMGQYVAEGGASERKVHAVLAYSE